MWEEADRRERRNTSSSKTPPFLKLILSRVISIAAVVRKVTVTPAGNNTWVELLSSPRPSASEGEDEKTLLTRFLEGIGKFKPQLVGYNSENADLRLFFQRALSLGLHLPELFKKNLKVSSDDSSTHVTEVDYFGKDSKYHLDLFKILQGNSISNNHRGSVSPSLREIATACGIPAKLGFSGGDVLQLWLDGRLSEIAMYNECDALTTYLLWLRMCHLAGFFTTEQYRVEEDRVAELLATSSGDHLNFFLREWEKRRQ
jgi:predicted PolB exonuclease-like 3'-5' exonuclease